LYLVPPYKERKHNLNSMAVRGLYVFVHHFFYLFFFLRKDLCIHKLLRRREVSGDAISWRPRRSHSSAGLVPKLLMPCVRFSKCLRDLCTNFFSKK